MQIGDIICLLASDDIHLNPTNLGVYFGGQIPPIVNDTPK